MIKFDLKSQEIIFSWPRQSLERLGQFFNQRFTLVLIGGLIIISLYYFYAYLTNGLGLAYNDARSHLDIGRRVVEGLKPGVAQLGSVWLPLDHVLMIPLIWNDWLWHSGLAGAAQNMIAFVATAVIIYAYLHQLGVGFVGRITGVIIFIANINILYLQSTAMTELLLLATMTVGAYELLLWHKSENITNLIKAAFWVMLSTLTRYDGWFFLIFSAGLVIIHTAETYRLAMHKEGGVTSTGNHQKFSAIIEKISVYKKAYSFVEGHTVIFLTLAALGVVMWFAWNQLIFKDALYFALGPFSAHAQQEQLRHAGVLATKGNLLLSLQVYFYALMYNSYTIPAILALLGAVMVWINRRLPLAVRLSTTVLTAPLFFNVLALYLGFSVLFVQGISGNTWFNVRYGIMLMPSIAIFIGFLVDRAKTLRPVIIGVLAFTIFFALANKDAVTIDDARVGSSQKNVSEVSGYLNSHALNKTGFVLISAASHDAIIFSSGLPMKRFIHEGTGKYWLTATAFPDRWARWIVMRTYDDNDLTWKAVKKTAGLKNYNLVAKYPFADVYELKREFIENLNTDSTGDKVDEFNFEDNKRYYTSLVSKWIQRRATENPGLILISAGYHDPIIFSSDLNMDRFITEGASPYWSSALTKPEQWARWIILTTGNRQDPLYDKISSSSNFAINYVLSLKNPLADVYELRPELVKNLKENTIKKITN